MDKNLKLPEFSDIITAQTKLKYIVKCTAL